MPVVKCTSEGKSGFKWGIGGKCFTGSGARNKARRQGIAIELSKRREGKKSEFDK